MDEIRLRSLFGNELRVAKADDDIFGQKSAAGVALLFGEHGFVLDRAELHKLCEFLQQI